MDRLPSLRASRLGGPTISRESKRQTKATGPFAQGPAVVKKPTTQRLKTVGRVVKKLDYGIDLYSTNKGVKEGEEREEEEEEEGEKEEKNVWDPEPLYQQSINSNDLFLLQLPSLPLVHQSDIIPITQATGLAGHWIQHKSGKVSLQLGNITLKISDATQPNFITKVAAIHSTKTELGDDVGNVVCELGLLGKRLVAVPNI
jgi:hypothetical protein